MHLAILGYLSRDVNTLPDGQTTEIVGGKGLFSAAAASRCGVETDLITWLPESDAELCLALQDYEVALHIIPIPTGTVNTNTHAGDTTLATVRLDPTTIEPEHLNTGMRDAISSSDMVLLAPDIQEKISLETIALIDQELGIPIAADVGKYFRTLQPDGQLVPRYPWPDQAQYLRHFTKVFVSSEDIQPLLDQGESFLSVARSWSEQGPQEIVITDGSKGAFVYDATTNEGYDIPAYEPRKLVDPTGAGDTFIAAYLAERLRTDNPLQAGKFAAMAASLKLNYPGPLQETQEQIDQALAERETV